MAGWPHTEHVGRVPPVAGACDAVGEGEGEGEGVGVAAAGAAGGAATAADAGEVATDCPAGAPEVADNPGATTLPPHFLQNDALGRVAGWPHDAHAP